MRKKIVAGNWKMNLKILEALELIMEIDKQVVFDPPVEVIIFPPATYLDMAREYTTRGLAVGAQNFHPEISGAFTGEVSAEMIASIGTEYALVGHSERRHYFNEDSDLLVKKINAALRAKLFPVYCCGESLEQREANEQFNVIEQQISEVLFHLNEDEIKKVVIAYEPVWAIGTGKTATTNQAQEVHAFIRQLIAKKYNEETANSISILYGGSCNPTNAKELFSQADIDGGLIGGASLKYDDFMKIVNSF